MRYDELIHSYLQRMRRLYECEWRRHADLAEEVERLRALQDEFRAEPALQASRVSSKVTAMLGSARSGADFKEVEGATEESF